ncbi:MAG: nucleotidyltransferase [Mobilitalea sp.]
MKVLGLITEYNPFHNGHKYHIEEAKRITNADYVIAVMSGNFVQRGAPAVINKYTRTAMALNNGIDLVLELPVCYATASAEYFSHGAVDLLNKLGVVDAICFGSECGDIELIKETAEYLIQAPASFHVALQKSLKEGMTYPAARTKAYLDTMQEVSTDKKEAITSLLLEPNNILGVEYVKALHRLGSGITPYTIKRLSAHYHDDMLSEEHKSSISSATAIRRAIFEKDSAADYFELMKQSVPEDVYQMLLDSYDRGYPISEEDFAASIKYKLLMTSRENLPEYLDLTPDLSDRIKKLSPYPKQISELAQSIKTRNVTLTRINRALVHLLLDIKKKDFDEYNAEGYNRYARVLGLRPESSILLRNIEESGTIPIITKVSKAYEVLDELAMKMLHKDILATDLYNQVVNDKFKVLLPNEYQRGIVIKP